MQYQVDCLRASGDGFVVSMPRPRLHNYNLKLTLLKLSDNFQFDMH